MSEYCRNLCDKISLRTTNYVAYVGTEKSFKLFPFILKSCKGIVVLEKDAKTKSVIKSKKLMRDVRFVEYISEFDKDAFDRVIYYFDNFSCLRNDFWQLTNMCCNLGLVCINNIPYENQYDVRDLLEKYGIDDFCFVAGKTFDIVFKNRKCM